MAVDELIKSLVEGGLITKGQLDVALESAKNLGIGVEKVLIDKGFITEEQYLKAFAERMKTTFIKLDEIGVDKDVVGLLPANIARKHCVIPVYRDGKKVAVAVCRPMDLTTFDELKQYLKDDIKPVFATGMDVRKAIGKYYRGASITEAGREGSVELLSAEDESSFDKEPEKLEKVAWGDKIVTTVNNIIYQAYYDRASDIHIEPTRSDVGVRFRIDGFLEEFTRLPKSMHLPLISRIKVIGNMDVAERRVPQDGRMRVRVSGKEIDLRIATYPTMFGEAAAIRLLSQEQLITLPNLGFLEGDLKIFREIITKPHGIFLVTGPTGSGKSTTLYAALMEINSSEKHILSIEDPVEHEIPGIDQQQVNVKAGVTFANALRAMLREDPDVIMVGEIRDHETAEIAVRAAMTGHLVFSTLHTNTAIGTIARLIDLGVEPFLVASTMVGVMAQRLVRRICQDCKTEIVVAPELRAKLGENVDIAKAYCGKGCDQCRNTGYRGRIGIFEIIPVTEDVRILINKRMPEVRIREKVVALGLHSMLEDGLEKIRRGLTTVEEVIRVTSE